MRTLLPIYLAWLVVLYAGVAQATPTGDAEAKYNHAVQLDTSGEYDKALTAIDEGLALVPRHLRLIFLKGQVLFHQHHYAAALAAYEACRDAGVTGQTRRTVLDFIKTLSVVRSTFLDITVDNGPADIYLHPRDKRAFCTAAPSCHEGILPGDYPVIAVRPGFERWTGRVAIAPHKPTKLSITLVETPSPLTVRVAQAGARISVDDTPYDAPIKIAAGNHRVVVALTGHGDARLDIAAHEGKPIDLDIALIPLLPLHIAPPDATLVLDGQPVTRTDGGIPVPAGPHLLVARARGFAEQRIAIPDQRARDYQLAIELAPLDGAAGPRPPSAGTDEPPARPRKLIAIGIAAAGGAALGVGLAFGLKARSTDRDIRALCGSDRACDSLPDYDRGHRLVGDARSQATIATVLVAAGGAAVAAGAIVWLTAPRERGRQAARVVPILGGNADVGLAVAGRF